MTRWHVHQRNELYQEEEVCEEHGEADGEAGVFAAGAVLVHSRLVYLVWGWGTGLSRLLMFVMHELDGVLYM